MSATIDRSGCTSNRFKWTGALAAFALLGQVQPAMGAAQQLNCSPGAVDDPISYGDLVTCEINPGTNIDQFRFQGSLGEVVVLQATRFVTPTVPSPGQPCLQLLRPDGTTLASICNNAASVRLNPTLDQTGEYRIRVTEFASNQVTPYNLVLDRVGGPASPGATLLDPGDILPGEIGPLGEVDFFAFHGQAGDTISLVATDTGGTAATVALQLFSPDGISLNLVQNQPIQATINRALTQSGVYSVLVWEFGNDVPMTYNLSYSCSGVTCPSLVLNDRYIAAASIEDIGGSGAAEVVALRQNRNTKLTTLLVKDGATKANIKAIRVFGSTIQPLGLASIGDQNGDLISELAVLGANQANGAIRVWVIDPDAGTVISSNTFFSSSFTPLGVTRVEDLTADGLPEVGVTAVNKLTNAVIQTIKSLPAWSLVNSISFPK